MPHIYISQNRLLTSNWLDKEWAKVERENIFTRIENWIIKQFKTNDNER